MNSPVSPQQFVRCEYYSRFGSSFIMDDPKRWNTYHRSLFKRIEGKKTSEYAFKPEESHKPDKSGTYYNPFHFPAYQSAISVIEKTDIERELSNCYDDFLTFQHSTAKRIARKIKLKNSEIKANADHGYPCVLIQIPKPDEAIKPTDWVNFCILYFTAIANRLSEEKGINCELVRRAGFGHIRPSIAETSPSFRLSVGFIPKAYADVLIETAEIVYQLICVDPHVRFGDKIKLPKLEKDIVKYNKLNKGKGKRVNSSLVPKSTLWENFWNQFDSQNHSFIYQVMRKEINAELVINLLFNRLRDSKVSLSEILEKEDKLKTVFVSPWMDIFRGYQLKNKRLTLNLQNEKIKRYVWDKKAERIEDKAFWKVIDKLSDAFCEEKSETTSEPTLDGLHERLETAARNFYFNPHPMDCEDGYGSDSDCEAKVDDDSVEQLYAKKFITATGMRAIQLAFAAIKKHLGEKEKVNYRNLGFFADNMYYETEEALKKHALKIELPNIALLAKSPPKVTLFDLNHCNTKHLPPKSAEEVMSVNCCKF